MQLQENPPGTRPVRLRRAGLTILEMAMAMTLLSIAFLMYSSATVSVNREREASRESAIASDAAREVIETLRGEPLSRIYALYNHNPADDPDGPGTAPGNRFTVNRLRPLPGMPDGTIGEVQLPEMEVEAGVWQLREDLLRSELGMPRDLNADSIVDANDHSLDYAFLPVRVRLDWQGRFGPRSVEMDTLIVDYRR